MVVYVDLKKIFNFLLSLLMDKCYVKLRRSQREQNFKIFSAPSMNHRRYTKCSSNIIFAEVLGEFL